MVETRALVRASDGLVENIIVYDPDSGYSPPEGYNLIPVADPVGVGDWYLNGAFLPNAIQATVIPAIAAVGETVTVTAKVPPNTKDTEVTFEVVGGVPIAELLSGSQASHSYAFSTPGTYRITVSSASHGSTTVGVIVQ